MTLSGGTGRMYVNGDEVASNPNMTLTPADMGNTTQDYIGRSQYPDPLLNASVDDFQIYDRALSAGEISALQTAPGAGNVASYTFDEAGGDTVTDSSGKGHAGTVVTPNLTPAGPPGLQTFAPGSTQDTIVTFTNTTGVAATDVKLSVSVPPLTPGTNSRHS